MTLPVDALNVAFDAAFPNRNMHGKCEAFRFQATRLSNGLKTMQPFDSAKLARHASNILGFDRTQAGVGDVGFWDKTIYEHDMLHLGSDYWVGATDLGDMLLDLGNGVKVIHGSSYPAEFMGFATHVGPNPHAMLESWAPVLSVPTSTPAGSTPLFAVNMPGGTVQKRIQVALWKRGRYAGPRNGLIGPMGWKGIQRTVANVGYDGPQNGVPGYWTCHYIQVYAQHFGRYTGPVNAILGPNSWEGFARGLEAGLRK